MVIGSYFGEQGSEGYILAIIVFTGLTLAYTLKGGLSSSLFSDVIQMGLFAVLLVFVLGLVFGKQGSIEPFVHSGNWSFAGGLDLFFVALIQIFSYPFHDPVMTDRGFIAEEKTTLRSFITAGILGFFFILLFSLIGVYGKFIGVSGQAAVEVAQTLGVVSMIIMNFIMITSASSTIDSAFSSISKLIVVDLGKQKKVSVRKGRIAMILTAVGGTIPIFFSPTILSATTISGTMVLGLAPIFIFWKIPAPKISFYLAVLIGFIAGIILVFNILPESFYLTTGSYADLLTVNFYGSILIIIAYFAPVVLKKYKERKYATV
jgi:Na+/proline symporter